MTEKMKNCNNYNYINKTFKLNYKKTRIIKKALIKKKTYLIIKIKILVKNILCIKFKITQEIKLYSIIQAIKKIKNIH